MYRKNCHKCHRASFSSAEYGKWLYPICGEDITVQKALVSLKMERINTPHRMVNEGSMDFDND
ncbi:hypothetical protein EI200_00465 [Peribacillus simplex]|uniref:hypothetical protein n=1 Tax=Peribacillus simplex TaxID=1478 RepID=UPI000F62C8FE|nr:hypothetical protein [Peribacillus simplex]RRN74878.1 hypothetical protein EI200_00465 [Peribacillus simplex]